jgi:predicted nucleic acid-binding protein
MNLVRTVVDASQGPTLVVDASAALAIVHDEPGASRVRRALADPTIGAGRRLVPDVFWLEVMNVLVRGHGATPEEVVEAVRQLDELDLESVCIDRPLLLLGLDLQVRHRLTAYDAAYLALAESEDAQLLTLDQRLADAAGDRAVRIDGLPPRRLAEEPAQYNAEPVDWARFGPYLARLRAEVRAAKGSTQRA